MQSLKQLQHRVNEKSPPGICYIVLRNQAPASEDDPPQKRIYMLRKKNTCKENITVLTCTVISIILYEKFDYNEVYFKSIGIRTSLFCGIEKLNSRFVSYNKRMHF